MRNVNLTAGGWSDAAREAAIEKFKNGGFEEVRDKAANDDGGGNCTTDGLMSRLLPLAAAGVAGGGTLYGLSLLGGVPPPAKALAAAGLAVGAYFATKSIYLTGADQDAQLALGSTASGVSVGLATGLTLIEFFNVQPGWPRYALLGGGTFVGFLVIGSVVHVVFGTIGDTLGWLFRSVDFLSGLGGYLACAIGNGFNSCPDAVLYTPAEYAALAAYEAAPDQQLAVFTCGVNAMRVYNHDWVGYNTPVSSCKTAAEHIELMKSTAGQGNVHGKLGECLANGSSGVAASATVLDTAYMNVESKTAPSHVLTAAGTLQTSDISWQYLPDTSIPFHNDTVHIMQVNDANGCAAACGGNKLCDFAEYDSETKNCSMKAAYDRERGAFNLTGIKGANGTWHDMFGWMYASNRLQAAPQDRKSCRANCAADPQCQMFTHLASGGQGDDGIGQCYFGNYIAAKGKDTVFGTNNDPTAQFDNYEVAVGERFDTGSRGLLMLN